MGRAWCLHGAKRTPVHGDPRSVRDEGAHPLIFHRFWLRAASVSLVADVRELFVSCDFYGGKTKIFGNDAVQLVNPAPL